MKRGAWTQEEDNTLKRLVLDERNLLWSTIAGMMEGRTTKQCRERYTNYLDPNLDRSPITEHEEHIIVENQNLYGNKWSTIAAMLPGRSPNQVKNYWYCLLRKQKGSKVKKRTQRKRRDGYIVVKVETGSRKRKRLAGDFERCVKPRVGGDGKLDILLAAALSKC